MHASMNLKYDLYKFLHDDAKDNDLARRKNYIDLIENRHVIIASDFSEY